jgi:hypothetical protein
VREFKCPVREKRLGLVAYVALVRSTVEGGKESKNEATGRDCIEKNGRCASRFLRMGCYRGRSKSFRVSFDLAFEDSDLKEGGRQDEAEGEACSRRRQEGENIRCGIPSSSTVVVVVIVVIQVLVNSPLMIELSLTVWSISNVVEDMLAGW